MAPDDREYAGLRAEERRPNVRLSNDVPPAPATSSGVWDALDDTISQTASAFARTGPEELAPFLTTLRLSVEQIINGMAVADTRLVEAYGAGRVLEYVRRGFIHRVHAAEGLDSDLTIRVLAAMEQIQCVIDRSALQGFDGEPVSDTDALGLIVDIAHDMRSPLAAILFLVDMLRSGRSGGVTNAQARQLGIVYSAAFGLSQLTTDLIDHVRGHDRLVERQPIEFSLSEVLHSVRDVLEAVAEDRGLKLEVSAPDGDVRLGYPLALNRILLNLATNAVKYTEEGAVKICARDLGSGRVEMSVADTGPGMPKNVLGQLFRQFRTLPRKGDYAFSSSGLGLLICQRLVSTLGSELRVSSSSRRGTKFVFTLELPVVEPA